VDLATLYRERRWVTLLGLIDQLRPASRLTKAMMDDPEVAEQILSAESSASSEWHPSLAEYGLTEQLLTQIIDLLQAQIATTSAAAGGKPDKPQPFPRPRTQVDIIRERRSAETQAAIISLFTPHAL